ncbi:MAG: DUF1501 domain-containing protein [Planctomycetota bacterium]|nr:MAG: DUF1501 domain-containing protein [Planctomycetota bacterium]
MWRPQDQPTCRREQGHHLPVQGGAVYGSSDRIGAFPVSSSCTTGDLAATIFWRFGINQATEMPDYSNRSYTLAAGGPISRLFQLPSCHSTRALPITPPSKSTL